MAAAIKKVLLVLFCLNICIFYALTFKFSKTSPLLKPLLKRPLFLYWTEFHRRKNHVGSLFDLKKCSFSCDFTANKSRLSEANIIFFHGCDLKSEELPKREPWQTTVFSMMESPGRSNHFYQQWDKIPMNFFNITTTYRKEADYWHPYTSLIKLEEGLPRISEEMIRKALKKKKKGIFSLISHCGALSKRDIFIQKLSKLTRIDKFGRCSGATKCDGNCEKKLVESYYFYLAFENTICEEYVTEKFDRFKQLIVPITLKRSFVPDFIPSTAYIAVDDFCSLEKLVEHLEYLMTNSTAYRSYFEWTKDYSTIEGSPTLCQMCEDLYKGEIKTSDYSKYKTIKEYFSTSQCVKGEKILENRC